MLMNDLHNDWDDADTDRRPGIVTLHTSGTGYWSNRAAAVRVTDLQVHVLEDTWGELRVHFNTDDWRVDQHGLIYTDPQWHRQLLEYLAQEHYDTSDVYYSEQGMQGDNYVSLDCGSAFIASWQARKK